MFIAMYRFSRPRCDHRSSSCPTRQLAVDFSALCCICLSSVNLSVIRPRTSFSPRSGQTHVENSTKKKTRDLAFASRCRTVSPSKTIRPKCLQGSTRQQPPRHHAESSVWRLLSVVALLDLMTLASSCSTSSSTHAPTSAFSLVL